MIPETRPTPPGAFIKEDILIELSLTQEQLAKALGVSRRTINQLVNEKRKITADVSLRLGKFTQTSPNLINSADAYYFSFNATGMVMTKTIVMIHGMWGSSWCWDY